MTNSSGNISTEANIASIGYEGTTSDSSSLVDLLDYTGSTIMSTTTTTTTDYEDATSETSSLKDLLANTSTTDYEDSTIEASSLTGLLTNTSRAQDYTTDTTTTTTTTDYEDSTIEASSLTDLLTNTSRAQDYTTDTTTTTTTTDYDDNSYNNPYDFLGNVTGALNFTLSDMDSEEEEVAMIQFVTYEVLLPMVIVTGVLITTIGLIILSKPKLRVRPVNKYYMLLLGTDVAVLLVSLSRVITVNGCRLYSYGVAFYFAHFFFSIFSMFQSFTLFIILWISYDRYLALWNFKRFQEVQSRRVFRIRLCFTIVVCVCSHLKHLLTGEVMCSTDGAGGSEVLGNAGVSVNYSDHQDSKEFLEPTCENGSWILKDEVHNLDRNNPWEVLPWVARGLASLIIPIILVVVFNGGIVAGLIQRRLNNSAATPRTRGRAYSSIYITLAISTTFFVCTMPITIYIVFYAETEDCRGTYSVEVFRAVANLLMVIRHLTHSLIFSFSENFRIELGIFLTGARRKIVSAFGRRSTHGRRLSQKTPNSSRPLTAPSSRLLPKVFVVSLPDNTDERTTSDRTDSSALSSTPPRLTTFSETVPLSPTRRLPNHLDDFNHSSRPSVITLDEEI
ncbi:uncharacterized protein LOC121876452 isoform X2 [Homarus americanus]|nr:uncharacterized protein LOC121876452 isoform X2 [Homarus americanus]